MIIGNYEIDLLKMRSIDMRQLTPNEQQIIKALIANISSNTGMRIGDVLCKLFPIEYIRKYTGEEPFYKKTIKICHSDKKDLESKLYEAFSLLNMLIEERYIIAKEFIAKDIIGKENPYCYPANVHYEEHTYFSYYDNDLWNLLNSHYSVTNALIDFSKDFKTISQRQFDRQQHLTWLGILIAVIIGIVSILGQFLIPITIKETQVFQIENTLKHLFIPTTNQTAPQLQGAPGFKPFDSHTHFNTQLDSVSQNASLQLPINIEVNVVRQ